MYHCAAGSIVFALSSFCGLFTYIASNAVYSRLLVAYPYALGSVLYTWGAYCSVLSSSACLSSFPRGNVCASSQISNDQQPAQTSCTASQAPSTVAGTSVQRPSGDGWQHERANERTALRKSSRVVEVEVCCSSGRISDPLLPNSSSARRQKSTETAEGIEGEDACSSVNVRLMEARKLQIGQLSDHDWGVIDWTGGKSIPIYLPLPHVPECKVYKPCTHCSNSGTTLAP